MEVPKLGAYFLTSRCRVDVYWRDDPAGVARIAAIHDRRGTGRPGRWLGRDGRLLDDGDAPLQPDTLVFGSSDWDRPDVQEALLLAPPEFADAIRDAEAASRRTRLIGNRLFRPHPSPWE